MGPTVPKADAKETSNDVQVGRRRAHAPQDAVNEPDEPRESDLTFQQVQKHQNETNRMVSQLSQVRKYARCLAPLRGVRNKPLLMIIQPRIAPLLTR
jgi:hypothetical protein